MATGCITCLLPPGLQHTSNVIAKVDPGGKFVQLRAALPQSFLDLTNENHAQVSLLYIVRPV